MATLPILPIKLSRLYSTQHSLSVKEAPTQTFKDGNLVQGAANGYAAATAGAGAAAGGLAIANAAGQNSAAPVNDLPIALIDGVSAIEITAGGSASSAALLQENVAGYGYAVDATTGFGYLNLADTTNVVFKILDSRPLQGAVGDTNVRVRATIIPTKRLT